MADIPTALYDPLTCSNTRGSDWFECSDSKSGEFVAPTIKHLPQLKLVIGRRRTLLESIIALAAVVLSCNSCVSYQIVAQHLLQPLWV